MTIIRLCRFYYPSWWRPQRRFEKRTLQNIDRNKQWCKYWNKFVAFNKCRCLWHLWIQLQMHTLQNLNRYTIVLHLDSVVMWAKVSQRRCSSAPIFIQLKRILIMCKNIYINSIPAMWVMDILHMTSETLATGPCPGVWRLTPHLHSLPASDEVSGRAAWVDPRTGRCQRDSHPTSKPKG